MMQILEILLLGLSYTVLIVALVFCGLCYQRKIEDIEPILFISSLLLLILSVSFSPLLDQGNATLLVLLSMLLVSASTFFNVLSERKHRIKKQFIKTYLAASILLFITTIAFYFYNLLALIEGVVVAFLIASVVGSMLLLRFSPPKKRFQHLEKTDNFFAIGFAILVPIYLILRFGFEEQYNQLQIGFMLPSAFILLGLNKIYDDLKRLSILKTGLSPKEQHFKNYHLTKREEEVAALLVVGKSYQEISDQLFISLPTVKTHTGNIYKKCQVKSRHEFSSLLNN